MWVALQVKALQICPYCKSTNLKKAVGGMNALWARDCADCFAYFGTDCNIWETGIVIPWFYSGMNVKGLEDV